MQSPCGTPYHHGDKTSAHRSAVLRDAEGVQLVGPSISMETCSHLAGPSISMETCSPLAGPSITMETCSPLVGPSITMETCSPLASPSITMETCSPLVGPPYLHEGAMSNSRAQRQHEYNTSAHCPTVLKDAKGVQLAGSSSAEGFIAVCMSPYDRPSSADDANHSQSMPEALT